ncbi:MAG: hypothetical protein IKP40_05265 [Clostridia bacterium]|nr:hypothetical protein [Clostridia bacterium]
MRCACPNCGSWMIHAESDALGCVCADCGARCDACLGTNTVVSRENLTRLADDPRFDPEALAALFEKCGDEPDDPSPPSDGWLP